MTGFLLEHSHAVVDESVVEVFATEMGVSIGSLHFKDAIFNGQKGNIESATTEIEDQHVFLLAVTLLVETVSNSGSSWLVDDSLDIEACNSSGILGSLSLRVIEVSGNSDDCRLDGLAEVSLCNFLHLNENHRGDLFSLEVLGLALVLDLDERLVSWS